MKTKSRVSLLLMGFLTAVAAVEISAIGQETATENLTTGFLANARQFTFEGRRTGEGYYSADGTKIVFQSERTEGNPFYQIYVLDLETGDSLRVSPGHGKTTCAWIHPENNKVLFSSTHDDPDAKKKQVEEIKMRESGQERRYSWDYDEHFEVYEYDIQSKSYKNLTQTKGYDAEGSYSPDGKLIAFASNRLAYSKEMSEKQKEKFKYDKAYMMDLFIMNRDGSGLKQLTTADGYDGGPFFSPDGKRICWRHFSEDGLRAEIWTMNIDGSDKKQLTKLGHMSWAPFYHPSGKYLIFNTNKHGFENFELYVVDTDGSVPPIRVTNAKGFDGLASFTPDGKQITWTSNRNKKQSQLFVADWNHEAILKAIGESKVEQEKEKKKKVVATSADFRPEDVLRHVQKLCAPEMEGRMTGSRGEKLATEYVAAYLDSLGFLPAGDLDQSKKATFFQAFPFPSGTVYGKSNQLTDGSNAYALDKNWRPLTFSGTGKFDEAPIVFAGYGISAPKSEKFEEYDSYVHLDVKDKWVMVFRYMPEDISPEQRQHLQYHSTLRRKARLARDKGARGIIFVSGPTSNVRQQLIPLTGGSTRDETSIGVLSVTDEVAANWLGSEGKSLAELQKKLDTGAQMMGVQLPKIKLKANVDVIQKRGVGRNVIARLQAGDKPSKQVIVIGAHIDHLGRGLAASSLAKENEQGQIHQGADDNASGVAAMLEVAEYLADQKRKGTLPFNRDVVIAAWSGEELNLYGSKHYVANLQKKLTSMGHGMGHGTGHGTGHGSGHGSGQGKSGHGKSGQGKSAHGSAGHGVKGHTPKGHAKGAKQEKVKGHGKQDPHNPHSVSPKNPHAVPPKTKNPHAANPHAQDPHAANPHSEKPGAPNPHAVPTMKPTIYPYVAAYVNLDMVGRYDKALILQGLGSSKYWRGVIERRNVVVRLNLKLSDDTNLPTDAREFYGAGVPILAAFTGSHSDYHSPRDTPEKLNYDKTSDIAKLIGLIARDLVSREKAPVYQEYKGEVRMVRGGMRATLGTVPDYSDSVKGVLIGSARKGTPAEKVGIKGGDVVVELAGKKVENIYDYTDAINALKVGQKTKIVVVRDGKRLTFEITPVSRD